MVGITGGEITNYEPNCLKSEGGNKFRVKRLVSVFLQYLFHLVVFMSIWCITGIFVQNLGVIKHPAYWAMYGSLIGPLAWFCGEKVGEIIKRSFAH